MEEEEVKDINNSKRNRMKKKESYQYKKYKCPECEKSYLSYQSLYTHKRSKHAYITKSVRKTICSDDKCRRQNEHVTFQTCSSNELNSSNLKEIMFSEISYIISKLEKIYEKSIKKDDKLIHHYSLFREYEIFLENEEKYKNSDSVSFIIDKVLLLYIVECDRTDPQPDMNEVVFYTILLREFINKEKQKELNLHYLLEFTTFNYSNEIILSSNKFLTLIEKIDLIKIKMDRAILYFQKLSSWLFKNNYTEFKLI